MWAAPREPQLTHADRGAFQAADYLAKPVSRERLVGVIGRYCMSASDWTFRKNEREPSLAVVSPDAGLASQLQTGAASAGTTVAAQTPPATTVAPSLPEIKSAADLTVPTTQVATQEGTLIPTPAIPVMQGDATWDRWNPAQVGTSSPCAEN